MHGSGLANHLPEAPIRRGRRHVLVRASRGMMMEMRLAITGTFLALAACNGEVASAPAADAASEAESPSAERVDCNDGSGKRNCCTGVVLAESCVAGDRCVTPCGPYTAATDIQRVFDCSESTHRWEQELGYVYCTSDTSLGLRCHDGSDRRTCCLPKPGGPCSSPPDPTECSSPCAPSTVDAGSSGWQSRSYCTGETWHSGKGLGLFPCAYAP